MLFRSILPFVLALAVAVTASEEIFTPNRISHASLLNDKPLLDSLTTDGLVSITGIPGFRKIKESTLLHLHECLLDSQLEERDSVFEAILKDGTVRRTLSSATIPGLGAQPIDIPEDSSSKCRAFAKNLDKFRSIVDKVTAVFAKQLGEELDESLQMPLMHTKDGEYSFDGVKDVVSNGEHLEHFHSYEKTQKDGSDTIELHTDQGLFIAFTPGLNHNENDGLSISGGFYIETVEGDTAMVEFSPEDDLVFMMGDGVNQYINPKLRADDHDRKLRATRHYVALGDNKDHTRIWFGRMVLPPSDAYIAKEDRTYGEVRRLLSDNNSNPNGLGCSSIHQRALDAGDNHGDSDHDGCAEGTFQCWFRCMPIPAPLSLESCSDENDPELQIKCINPRGQVSNGFQHGDYYPDCTNSTAEVTDYPKLENYPQDENVCTDSAWADYLAEGAEDFDHAFDLTTDKTAAKFFWKVAGGDGDMIHGRLSFNGLFGYISLGFANLNAGPRQKNGMNGAQIIMATPGNGSDYSPVTGFDVSEGEAGYRISEYVISFDASAFRHWNEPVGQIVSPKASNGGPFVSLEVHDCFTSLDFTLDSIYETKFNTTGTNRMLWAANGEDSFAGYHGKNRAVFTVDWESGEGIMESDKEEEQDVPLFDQLGDSGAMTFAGTVLSFALATFLVMILN